MHPFQASITMTKVEFEEGSVRVTPQPRLPPNGPKDPSFISYNLKICVFLKDVLLLSNFDNNTVGELHLQLTLGEHYITHLMW